MEFLILYSWAKKCIIHIILSIKYIHVIILLNLKLFILTQSRLFNKYYSTPVRTRNDEKKNCLIPRRISYGTVDSNPIRDLDLFSLLHIRICVLITFGKIKKPV